MQAGSGGIESAVVGDRALAEEIGQPGFIAHLLYESALA
jgi:hypothetical protein